MEKAVTNASLDSLYRYQRKKGGACCYEKASGASGIATRVTITAKLQQYVNGTWVTVNTFTLDENSYAGTLSESCHVSKGYTYRVSATVCVRAGLSGETQQVTSREVKY